MTALGIIFNATMNVKRMIAFSVCVTMDNNKIILSIMGFFDHRRKEFQYGMYTSRREHKVFNVAAHFSEFITD